MDITTIIGIIIGVASIWTGLWMETAGFGSVGVAAGAIIVLGGTLGAVITTFPTADLRRASRQLRRVVFHESRPLAPLVPKIVDLARKSRREGLLVLENEAENAEDPFFRQALNGLIDGHEGDELRDMLERSIDQQEQYQEPGVRLFEKAGAYAPTIGILGAVMGLIHVMQNLDVSDHSTLGPGIAVAFVATFFGVAAANLVFFPFAGKIRMKIEEETRRKEMILEGVCAIQEGINPVNIERRLNGFLEAHEADV